MNSIFSSFLRFLDTSSPPQKARAHCDIPCGVYEVDSMKWAATTCSKLVDKILALEIPDPKNKRSYIDYHNTFSRAVLVKEEYAKICKEQLLILWTDYFKPEHLAAWPNLHEKVWKATKQCSIVKRTVDAEEVKKLKTLLDEIAEIFVTSKK